MKIPPSPTPVTRRGFLQRGAASASWLMLGAVEAAAEADGTAGPESSWEAIRRQFDLDRSVVHMTGLLLASHPRPVREAIHRYRQALDRNPPAALQEFSHREHAGREAAARYLAVDADDIALTDSTTMGLGLQYGGMRIRSDQEILSTRHDQRPHSSHPQLRGIVIRNHLLRACRSRNPGRGGPSGGKANHRLHHPLCGQLCTAAPRPAE